LAGWDYEQISPPLNDQRVDNIAQQSGEIDRLPVLSIDLPDAQIISNLNARINDAQTYWDIPEGFNLREARNENTRLHLGRQIDVTHLYRFQVPYVENEIFVAVETIVAYLTSQTPQAEVYPAKDSDQSKKIAIDLEKALIAHSQQFELSRKLEVAVRDVLLKRIGIIKLRFDPNHGDHGEIVPEVINPEHIIVDKNAAMGDNPAFICHVLKMSVEELCARFPEKKNQIYEALGIIRGTPKQMSQEVAVREVWLTNYNKKYEAEEVVVWYFGKLVLDKIKNPNWMYSGGSNFLQMPMKPFIPLNYINDGSHWIDVTTPIEQGANTQNILNKRGRQIMENADKANGVLIISTDSGLTKDDAQNLTGDPNQKLIIKTAGQDVRNLVYQVPPHDLPSYVMDDKFDLRSTIHAIIGTPSEFTGSDDNQDKYETLGKAMMVKNQASGRQDLIGRAVASFMNKYFQFLTQMMAVWYDSKHYFVYNGGDGEFDYVTMHRDLLEDGMVVQVKSGTTQPFDKARQEATALQLAKMGMISPLDLYKDLHMDNTQKRYDNWFKWKTDPQSLALDALDAMDDSEAYVDYVEIMAGRPCKPRDDASKEHILTHRKQMLTDVFLKAKPGYQKTFVKHVQDELQSLELRTSLDEMSQQSMELLNPSVPIQPPQPPMPPMMGAPGMMPPPGGAPMGQPPMGMPPQGPPMGGAPQPANLGSIFGGTGLPNPANPQTPPMGSVTALPAL
jgi:hypothetical protein